MSIFDAIASGVTNGVKAVLGIHDAPTPQATPAPTPARKASASHPTTFGGGSTSASTSSPSLGDQLFKRVLQGVGGSAPRTSPLPTGNTRAVPPSPSTTNTSTATHDASLAAGAVSKIRVFDSSAATADGRAGYVGSVATLDAGAGTSDARIAADNVKRGLDYFASTFGRAGIDNAGSGVDIVINDHSTDASGAELFHGNGGYYTTADANGNLSEAIRWGDGISYQHQGGGVVDQTSMLHAEDLTIHEMTHGIIKHETGSLGGTADEAGSVNEGFADVIAASATRDWKLGESMYASDSDYRYMRNLAQPDDRSAVHTLWTNMDQYRSAAANGTVEEHYASGIISTVAARMQADIGGDAGFQAVEQLYYHTITDHRMGDMSFAQVASGLRTTASSLWGIDDNRTAALERELQAAGL